jgi:hypothetical protein
MSKTKLKLTFLVIVIGTSFAIIGQDLVGKAAGLYALSASPQPYLQAVHAGLLYIFTPAVVICSFLLYLAPGAIISLALGQARNSLEWVLFAFGCSLVLSIVLSTGAKLVLGPPLSSSTLVTIWLIATALICVFLGFKTREKPYLPFPITERADGRRLLWMLFTSYLAICALFPKIFWENFNLDGIEAFEFGRSLTNHLLPYWEIHQGVFGFYQNFMLFAYPNHWFISLFGPFEAAARLPFILYIMLLFATVVLLIEYKQVKKLSALEETVLWLGLSLFTIVQVYNTNYEPFFADIAEMAATDTLWVTCFFAACYALWTARYGWFWIFALMTYMSSPGGLLLLGALTAATFLAKAPSWRKDLQALTGVILFCLLVGFAYEFLYSPLLLDGAKDQFSSINLLKRLYPPTVNEFPRLNALLYPSGLLPALSLLFVRRKEPVSWMIAFITIFYFLIMYLQAWTSLHQFTPIMVLPLVVFWRVYLHRFQFQKRWLLPTAAIAICLCFFLSLPRHFKINQAIREFGQRTAYKIGNYEQSYEDALRAGWTLYALVPKDYRLKYPEQPWGADPPSWIYYATQEKRPGTNVNYVIQPAGDPPLPEATLVMARDGVSVYVRSVEVWNRDRQQQIPQVVISSLYEPIYRRTYSFFREYVNRLQKKALEENET